MKRNNREAATAIANGAFEDGENNQHNGTSLVEPFTNVCDIAHMDGTKRAEP